MYARLTSLIPILQWGPAYQRRDLKSDLIAGLTHGAMVVPQGMAYALLAGLPPVVGLYAATVPMILYAVLGTSRQLAVGPVAIVSLLVATALAPIVEQGTAGYLAAAALLALMVGVLHLLLALFRLGFVVNFLSHGVLVGFTAAAALIIGLSQIKHVLGVSIPRTEQFLDTGIEVAKVLPETHGLTLVLGAGCLATLIAIKKFIPRLPGPLIVVVASTIVTAVFGLADRGVATVGSIPGSLPAFAIPGLDVDLMRSLLSAALIITIVGFMESVAVAKVYARRNRYDLVPNQELVGLGMANVAAGVFSAYPVTGGFSRTAVNASAGARTQFASLITAAIVILTLLVLTPLFESLPQAALGAIIIMAVVNLIDITEMRHIAQVKRSDLLTLAVAFFGTLLLGIELGIAVAVLVSMLVVFARMSKPFTAVLGKVPGTLSYRNIERFPDAEVTTGVRVIRMDAALSFVNAAFTKQLLLEQAKLIEGTVDDVVDGRRVLVLECSGINDLDVTGAGILDEVLDDLEDHGVELYLSDVKGPTRDVLEAAHLWERFAGRVFATTDAAVRCAVGHDPPPPSLRAAGIHEREDPAP